MRATAQHINQPQLHSCYKCRYEAVTSGGNKCPRCGRRLYTMRDTRWRGFFLLVIGAFLSLLMLGAAFFVTALLVDAGKNPASAREINEESHILLIAYGIFALVIVMGGVSMLMGIWQMIFGRRNMVLIWIFFALIALTFIVGGVFRGLAG